MTVTVETLENLKCRFIIEVSIQQVSAAVNKKIKSIAQRLRLDGFRPGKVPLAMVHSMYAASTHQEVVNEFLHNAFNQTVRDQLLKVAGDIAFEFLKDRSDDSNYRFYASYESIPAVPVIDFAAIEVEVYQCDIDEAAIDETIERIREQMAEKVAFGSKAKDGSQRNSEVIAVGDWVVLQHADHGKREVYVDTDQAELAAALSGKKIGDQVSLNLGSTPTSQDQEAPTYLIEAAFWLNKPKIDDDFVKNLGIPNPSVEALRKAVSKSLSSEIKRRINHLNRAQVLTKLSAVVDMPLPESFIKADADSQTQQAKQNIKNQYGVDANAEIEKVLMQQSLKQAPMRVKNGLLIADLIEKQALAVSMEDVRAFIQILAVDYDDPQRFVNNVLSSKNQLANYRNILLEYKAIEFVHQQAKTQKISLNLAELRERSSDI